MIKCVLVIHDRNKTLHCTEYGEGASLFSDPDSIGGFLSAAADLGPMLSMIDVSEIRLGDVCFLLHKRDNLLFTIAIDEKSNPHYERRLMEIVSLFTETYATTIKHLTEDTVSSVFDRFAQIITDHSLAP